MRVLSLPVMFVVAVGEMLAVDDGTPIYTSTAHNINSDPIISIIIWQHLLLDNRLVDRVLPTR